MDKKHSLIKHMIYQLMKKEIFKKIKILFSISQLQSTKMDTLRNIQIIII